VASQFRHRQVRRRFAHLLGISVKTVETHVASALADFLDSRLSLLVTGYRKTTDDALLRIPVAPSVYGAKRI
jgi:hypothetical protein